MVIEGFNYYKQTIGIFQQDIIELGISTKGDMPTIGQAKGIQHIDSKGKASS